MRGKGRRGRKPGWQAAAPTVSVRRNCQGRGGRAGAETRPYGCTWGEEGRKKHKPAIRTAERQRLIEAHQISVRKRRPGQFRDARNAYSNARQRLAQTSFSLLDRPRPVFSFSPGEKEKMGGGEGPATPIAETPVLIRAPKTKYFGKKRKFNIAIWEKI